MAMKSIIVSSAAAVLLMTLLWVNVSEAVITCNDVSIKAASCLSYATGKITPPAAACCSGLLALANSVKSVDDKKTICKCLKDAVKPFAGVQDKYLSQIPTACKIKVSFPVSLKTNCETIH